MTKALLLFLRNQLFSFNDQLKYADATNRVNVSKSFNVHIDKLL